MIQLGRTCTYEEIMESIRTLTKHYPEYLTYYQAGTSHDGREIPGIRLGSSDECLICSAGIHGRESVNPVLMVHMMNVYCEKLAGNHKTANHALQKLFKKYSIYFLPLLNPDGYEIALWGFHVIQNPILRQAMRRMEIPHEVWKANARGIDINRNFPCKSFVAQGSMKMAGSENETKALMRAFETYPKSLGYLDFHSRGRIIYYYRSAMPYLYNRQGNHMAKRLQRICGYEIGTKREEFGTKLSGGNSVNYYSESYEKLAITIETVDDLAGFPLAEYHQLRTYREIRQLPLVFLNECMPD